MNQQVVQVIINDTSSNSIGRVLLGGMNPNGGNNFNLASEIGPLLVSVGGWNLPRAPNTTRVYFAIIGDQKKNLEKFFQSLESFSPTFLPGDKLIFAQQNSGRVAVDRANWCNYNYTRVQMDLKNIEVQRFLALVTDVVKNDQRAILTSANY